MVIQMRFIRCCSLALVGLFVVLAGYAPRAFSQSFDLSQAVEVADLTPPPMQQAVRVSLSDQYIQTSNKCAFPVVELGDGSGLVLPTAPLSLGVGLSEQSNLVPICSLPPDATQEQRDRFDACLLRLECERFYGCFTDDGDQLASCRRRVCG